MSINEEISFIFLLKNLYLDKNYFYAYYTLLDFVQKMKDNINKKVL